MKNDTLRCMLSGEEISPFRAQSAEKPITLMQGDHMVGIVLGHATKDIRKLQLILERHANGKFVGVQAQCLEAMETPYGPKTDV